MWNFVVLAVLISAGGVYATWGSQALDDTRGDLAASLAADMGIYRTAVTDYFNDHDVLSLSVSTQALKSGGYLPGWSRMFQQSAPLIWNNYRDTDGVIYVYASQLPPLNIDRELAQLAQNSVLLGTYRSASATLVSPTLGSTGIPVSALSAHSIPDGAPVWIAMKK